ncbi:MAG: hypothetical protein ACK4SA_03910 [Caldilinea sp.]
MPTRSMVRPNWLFLLFLIAALLFVGIGRAPSLSTLAAVVSAGFEWVLLLAGVALLLGVVNVVWLHIRRIALGQRDWPLSLALIAVLAAVAVAGLLNPTGARSPLIEWVFDAVIAPGQSALFAMLVFFMAAAAYQYLRIGRRGGVWMLIGFLVIVLAQTPLGIAQPGDADTAEIAAVYSTILAAAGWLLDTPVMAAIRGALLGGVLALLVVGLRLLLRRSS